VDLQIDRATNPSEVIILVISPEEMEIVVAEQTLSGHMN